MNKKISVILLITVFTIFFSCGTKSPSQTSEESETPDKAEREKPTRAELVMNALLLAYPDKIEKIEFRNDDWALLLRDTWYYFAGGRMLPEHRLEHLEEYRPLPFYPYPAELPPWTAPSDEDAARFSNWTASRRDNTVRRSSFLIDALWQAATRLETENNLARITFLGKRTRVHHEIVEKLASVETEIQNLAKTDSVIQTWINNIGTLEGWSWRDIADTQARSYHSYGLAVDLLPRSMGGRQTYWLWTSQYRDDWWNVPYKERYHPPDGVIKIFEEHGFVWGGKWAMFDTMHFEYRPEIMKLSELQSAAAAD